MLTQPQHSNRSGQVKFHPHLSAVYDGKIRLKAKELSTAALAHNFSYLDDQIQAEVPGTCVAAGSTEWTGQFSGRSISIGWDWFVNAKGQIQLFKAVAPRSNICLIDHHGYDLEDLHGSNMLFTFFETGFWHAPIHDLCASTGVRTKRNLAI